MNRVIFLALSGLLALTIGGPTTPSAFSADKDKPDPVAVQNARKTVRILDDVYKTAIVLITDKYVKDKRDYPAGRAAIKWFADITKTGSHEIRLIDVTGEPYSPTNVAKDAFEEEGIKQLKAGKDYYEKVVQKDGKSYLRAITPIPVVLPRCILCHENYKDVKKGQPVGALTYTMPLD